MGNPDRRNLHHRSKSPRESITSDELVTSGPTQLTHVSTTGEVKLRDGSVSGDVIAYALALAGDTKQLTNPVGWFFPNGLFVEVISGAVSVTVSATAPVVVEEPEVPPPPEHTEGILIDLDPEDVSNVQASDDFELAIGSEPADKSGNGYDITFDGVYIDALWWRDGTDINAPNERAYWERTEARNNIFETRILGNPMSGIGPCEHWAVVRSENDPAGDVNKAKGYLKFGSDVALAFWPIEDLGGGTRDVYMHFGTTVRERILHATLVSKGLTVPFFDTWHLVRVRVSGAVGAGLATIDIWINGNLIQTTAGKTIGHDTTPRWWVGGSGDPWAGKMARFQVFNDNLTDEEAAAHTLALKSKFGIT